jgi:Zn-dependent protease with chaperone function
MIDALRFVALNAAALLGFGVVVALGGALAHRAVIRWSRGRSPALRARVLVAWAAAPVAIPTVLVALALSPSVGAAFGVAVDHCPEHAGHVHLCLHHLPASGPAIFGALALAAIAFAAGLTLVHAFRSAALVARLARAPAFPLGARIRVVVSSRPFAVAAGWVRPTVLVSTALVDRLSPAQLEIVVAHERAHVARRDALVVAAARILALAHLPSVRRELLAELTLACELACDEAAAAECGDRVLVAETIVAAERAAAAPPFATAGLAFGDGDVGARVESLLVTPVEGERPLHLRWILLAAGGLLAFAAPHVHHWTETLLHYLPH